MGLMRWWGQGGYLGWTEGAGRPFFRFCHVGFGAGCCGLFGVRLGWRCLACKERVAGHLDCVFEPANLWAIDVHHNIIRDLVSCSKLRDACVVCVILLCATSGGASKLLSSPHIILV